MSENVTKRHWDAIIVGTGMGAATAGYALAKAGKRVLFCEKGRFGRSSASTRGHYAEEDMLGIQACTNADRRDILARGGREWTKIEDCTRRQVRAFVPFIGAGTGGSTALYGMALERFFPQDFTPHACFADADDSTLPDEWPITYPDLLPFYEEAERLYRVRGTPDPLRGAEFHPPYLDPPMLSAAGEELYGFLQEEGCHPYRLPMACEFVSGCTCCQGYLCPRDCKNDSGRICLEPAIDEYGAELLDECEVVRLEATQDSVKRVICVYRGELLSLHGSVVILGAGALQTPRILLQSSSAQWPDGLANRSGQVGRNLMRHFVDLYVIRPKAGVAEKPAWKELAFNDYYFSGGQKLGSVQAFGALPSAAQLVEGLADELRRGHIPAVEFLFRPAKPLLRRFLEYRLSGSLILASVVEDRPYFENRVALGPGGHVRLYYRLHAGERARIAQMRARLGRLLKSYRPMLIKQAENNERLAHAGGTCRFGLNPAESVLDAHNCAHGLGNLYVVDASFFPSSAGINPSLTIAANALRVVQHLILR